jgi:CRP/FNR family cyclic AMP-dependent transcriptional regulator
MQTLDEMLALSPWAKDLSPEQLAKVRAGTVLRDFEAGAFVCRKGEPAAHWIGVVDGLVKINAFAETGKSVTFAGVPAGSWIGEGSVLKREPRKYDITALRDSRVAMMPESTFHWLLDNSIAFNRFLLTQLNERLSFFIGMIEQERLLDPDARVARSLSSLFNQQLYPGARPDLHISQEELGHLAGVSRQRANQALQTLEGAGLLKVDYGVITILDVDGLRTYVG